jgi:hypothetical protein
MKYRNEQQEVVEAVQFVNPYGKDIEECFNKIILPNWLKVSKRHIESSASSHVFIFGIENDIDKCYCEVILPYIFQDVGTYGTLKLYGKDWMICNAKGELYTCKDDIFKMTYERVVE